MASSIVLRSWSVLLSVGPAAFGQRAGWSRAHAAPEQPPWQRMVVCHSIGASRQSASTCCAVGQRKDAACYSERASHQSASTCCAAVSWQVGEDALHWHYPKGHSPSESRWTSCEFLRKDAGWERWLVGHHVSGWLAEAIPPPRSPGGRGMAAWWMAALPASRSLAAAWAMEARRRRGERVYTQNARRAASLASLARGSRAADRNTSKRTKCYVGILVAPQL